MQEGLKGAKGARGNQGIVGEKAFEFAQSMGFDVLDAGYNGTGRNHLAGMSFTTSEVPSMSNYYNAATVNSMQ